MINISGLTKNYGTLSVLKGVDLDLESGKISALIGPNGAGKSTMLKCLLGLVHPDNGEILFDGKPVIGENDYRARIGYMPQVAAFPGNLSGNDVMQLLKDIRPAGIPTDTSLIRDFSLEEEMQKPIKTLSGGNKQKVNAVMTFLFSPDLLIFDEPTAGLDPVSSQVFKRKVLQAKSAGKTIILTSHVMSELEELSDNILFLLDGKLQFSGKVETLKSQTQTQKLETAIAQIMTRESA